MICAPTWIEAGIYLCLEIWKRYEMVPYLECLHDAVLILGRFQIILGHLKARLQLDTIPIQKISFTY